jgi:hypothetical protein
MQGRVFYVGCITEPEIAALDGSADDLVTAVGRHMDDGRTVRFRVGRDALRTYYAEAATSEDAYLVVTESDVIKISGRYGRDLWTSAGLPWSTG